MHRFFVTERDIIGDHDAVIKDRELIHQWVQVLRFTIGEHVVLLLGDGEEHEVSIRVIKKDAIELDIVERRFNAAELPMRVFLAQSYLKQVDKFEFVLQKGVEIGYGGFIPLVSARTEKKMEPKTERWEKIIQEAAEQAGRGLLPELKTPKTLKEILETEKQVIIPHVGAPFTLSSFAPVLEKSSGLWVVCIGPEGGFTDEEIKLAEEKGAHIVGLGPRVLRSETAGIVAGTIIAQAFNQL